MIVDNSEDNGQRLFGGVYMDQHGIFKLNM